MRFFGTGASSKSSKRKNGREEALRPVQSQKAIHSERIHSSPAIKAQTVQKESTTKPYEAPSPVNPQQLDPSPYPVLEAREDVPETDHYVRLEEKHDKRKLNRDLDSTESQVQSPQTKADDDVQLMNSSYTLSHSEYDIDQQVSSDTLTRIKNGPMPNPEALITSHLLQWKFAAEQGSPVLRVPAVLGSVGLMITTVVPYFMDVWALSLANGIISACVFFMAVIICFLDGRFSHDRNPLGFRARLRNIVTTHLNVFKLVWGRGLLYILAGFLNLAHEWMICYYSGGFMMLVGVIAIYVGGRASRSLANLRGSLSDDNFLYTEFHKHDKNDEGSLTPNEFANFISDMGIEFDDVYTLRAFNTIDVRHKGKITFSQFKTWWKQFEFDPSDDPTSYSVLA